MPCAFALMNTLGLVCDPVGGLVEIPMRLPQTSPGRAGALAAAQLPLAGVRCAPFPCDEMILP
jgi:L-serine dehydratase